MTRFLQLISSCVRYSFFFLLGKDQLRRQTLKTSVASLGGVYVKMMQFLMLRTELFSREDKLEFLGFFDQVPIQEIDLDFFLRQELSPKEIAQFASIESKPFASGTFGQVYKATLKDGQQVVIKVKRQNITLSLFFDFLMIKAIAWVTALVIDQHIVDLKRLVSEFADITWQELNYQKEVENALILYEFYQNHPTVVIPFTYAEFSTQNIIVQEYIDGIGVTQLLHKTLVHGEQDQWLWQTYQTDLKFIIKHISYSLLRQSFLLDRFYSDPHPGNIKILPNNKFAFIDFGIMAEAPPNKQSYHKILEQLTQSPETLDAHQLSRSFFEFTAARLLQALETCDEYALTSTSITPQVVERYQSLISSNKKILKKLENVGREDYSLIWQELLTMGEQFRMQLPPGIFAALRSAFLIKSFTFLLQPNIFVMRDVYKEVTQDIDVRQLDEESEQCQKIDPETALEEVADWLTNLLEHDMFFYWRLVKT